MAVSPNQWIAALSDIALSIAALYAAFKLFKDHRAPAVGFFLLGGSAVLCSLPLSRPSVICVQGELEWAGGVLGPALVSFGFLWLSQDQSTAHVLLLGSASLLGLRDWLSPEALVVMSRSLALSSLCCSLTVCLFTANVAGALGSVALSLPALVAPVPGAKAFTSLVTPGAAEDVLKCLLKGLMVIGCLSTKHALGRYLLDLQRWD
ncbi:hypothetical protein SKAU_G00219370 [Synaphobranchus kaupii]|uniref:Uncharacterized protein n=1 Tax=Synaphobranchus kaupii TaxID=118154 RepID=A0A9Q1FAL7_SYNKA|nr:hypothetical protein SKAU_G00219370 [Synaphobranchus kaupii]